MHLDRGDGDDGAGTLASRRSTNNLDCGDVDNEPGLLVVWFKQTGLYITYPLRCIYSICTTSINMAPIPILAVNTPYVPSLFCSCSAFTHSLTRFQE
jgi:hypothetical protein